ncbi:hypothetical protein [Nitrosopumilus sp. S4]
MEIMKNMGFKKIFGKVAEKIEDKAQDIKVKREERKRIEAEEKAQIESQIKEFENILDKFEIKHLQSYCADILGMEPREFEKDNDGNKREIKPNRKTFEYFIIEQFKDGNTKLNQLKDFALKRKLVVPSFFGMGSDESGDEREFQNIINEIEHSFEPERILDEKELQSQLTIFLKAKYPNRKIEREVITQNKDKLDIVIDGKFVFELKVPKSRTDLRNLSAQLEEYSEQYPNVCAIIADTSKIAEDVESGLTQNIKQYADKYKVKLDIQSLVFEIVTRK